MLKNLDLLKLISEPKKGEGNPASRYALHLRPEIVQAYLAESYAREVARRGAEIENPEDVNAKLRAVARWLTDGQRKPFLLLYGENPGQGKTTLALAIYRALTEDIRALVGRLGNIIQNESSRIEKKKNWLISNAIGPELYEARNSYNYTSRVLHDGGDYDNDRLKPEHPDLFQRVQSIKERAQGASRPLNEKYARLSVPARDSILFVSSGRIVTDAEIGGRKTLERYRTIPILFLDDVGGEADSVNYMGNRILPVTEILLERYDSRAVTIITGNLSDKGLADRYGVRVADRLNEVADKIAFTGQSYRK